MMEPRPLQRGQVCWTANMPWLIRTWPDPEQVSQVTGAWPRAAPEPHDDKRPVPSASAGSKMSSVPVLIRGGHLSMRNLSMRVPSLLVAALFCCCIFPAAADDGKPRYVSGSGEDKGWAAAVAALDAAVTLRAVG